ncbi:Het-C-domain-containing protein [Obba rivulosa]|uniref:Het-C-domain-containing protein n=1 Tax=Obba rivulosa TaxID=1052685 RepID=A0A8E2AP61_9APHY|nr:Het-C-domain-containing protein [Obba rivulosa]
MAVNAHLSLLLLCIIFFCISGHGVHAFGAGNIPSFAYLEGKAFRHGDIEDTLAEIAKKAGGFALGALIGKGGSKFGQLDIKRVYFGNWLRDYSQAVDVAGLQKLSLQAILNLCMALGFLAHGYATHEFEVTEERLGVYLPTEHIDNPKGYPDNARQYDQRLRGPVDPRELEIDPRTGMKNYIANENGSWDTSKALIRRTLERCIQLGRMHRANGRKQDEYEAYRLLGQALHTLEDFAAHSNFCELALVSLGHRDIFVHVGDQIRIQAPNGRWVAPLVTGTFGSSDFIHSLLGEATDHISQASVTDLNAELAKARAKSGPDGSGNATPSDVMRDLLFKLPGGDSDGETQRELTNVERIRAGPYQPGAKRPDDMSPQELHAVLWQVLTFRDSVVKKIEKTIEKIPGLGPLIDKLMDSISVFVFTTLEPFLKPIMKQATTGLMAASGEVIDKTDQYEVFDNPTASDPTHSFLSKDHFNLILNEPAGHLGKIVLTHTTNLVVKAWDDTSMNVHQITEDILQSMFHPDFHDRSSRIQSEMLAYMQRWVSELGARQAETLGRLTKSAVRAHQNIRLAGAGGPAAAEGTFAQHAGVDARHDIEGYLTGVPGVAQAQSLLGKLGGGSPGVGGGSLPGIAQAQSFMNMLSPGQSGPRRNIPPGPPSSMQSSSYAPPSEPPYPGAHSQGQASQHHHGHDAHRHSTQHHGVPSTGQTASYYTEQSSVTMPGGETRSSVYEETSYPPARSSYPSAPSAAFSNEPPATHPGYSPSYTSGYGSSGPEFPSASPRPPAGPYGAGPGGYGEGGGYPGYPPPPRPPPGGPGFQGGYAPPPGPPPGGPGFQGGYAPPPGPPPQFPGSEYPPAEGYGPPHHTRHGGW